MARPDVGWMPVLMAGYRNALHIAGAAERGPLGLALAAHVSSLHVAQAHAHRSRTSAPWAVVALARARALVTERAQGGVLGCLTPRARLRA